MKLKNVTLELSGKPFRDESGETMHRVCRTMFGQWRDLAAAADTVSVLLWIADGSEILDYTGDMDRTFEWGCWIGVANHRPRPEQATERKRRDTHCFPKKYIPEAAPRSYAWLKQLVAVLRETGTELTGKPVRIGAAFDLGPEFALSDFKYRRHIEIMGNDAVFPHSNLTCDSLLHADSRRYAAFPGGIPEGASVGTFLAAQFREFARDLGYDYLWLSNGMGFGSETWGIRGALFDKRRFHPERADAAAARMLRFWDDFFRAYPDCVIETRGSNYSAGIEMATDAAPLAELYREGKIAPPVNSPVAALNYTIGLELASWMSHVAELPADRFPFRFYAHDPWFLNSPWLDRYGREPWDIWKPLSVARLDGEGNVRIPNEISILTVDDTLGRMPDRVPRELTAYFYDAFDTAPDAPGPFVWVYPFEEYSDFVRGERKIPEAVFCEDFYLGKCVQEGFPLNTVVSTGNFRRIMAERPELLRGAVLVMPLSAVTARNLPVVRAAAERGQCFLFYGALRYAEPELRPLLGLECAAEELSGAVRVVEESGVDSWERNAPPPTLHVLRRFSAGGLAEVPAADGPAVYASAEQEGKTRVLSSARVLPSGAVLGFVRGVPPCDPAVDPAAQGFERLGPESGFPGESLMRRLLPAFGWRFGFRAFRAGTEIPRPNVHRHDNAFYFTVFNPDADTGIVCSTPFGAPLFFEHETRVCGDAAFFHTPKSFRRACRCFVRQEREAVVRCGSGHAETPEYEGRFYLHGLDDAEVRIFLPPGAENHAEFTRTDFWEFHLEAPLLEPEWETGPQGTRAVLRHLSGCLQVAWGKGVTR